MNQRLILGALVRGGIDGPRLVHHLGMSATLWVSRSEAVGSALGSGSAVPPPHRKRCAW